VAAPLDIRAEVAVTEFVICYADRIFFDLIPQTGNLPPEGNECTLLNSFQILP
jgi:hypothetical protein